MGTKIEKPSAFHNVEGCALKEFNLTSQNDTANIVDMNGKTKPLPALLSRGCI